MKKPARNRATIASWFSFPDTLAVMDMRMMPGTRVTNPAEEGGGGIGPRVDDSEEVVEIMPC